MDIKSEFDKYDFIGYHFSVINDINEYKYKVIQIFCVGPRQYSVSSIVQKCIDMKYYKKHIIYSHSSYLFQLSHINKHLLKMELTNALNVHAKGLVIHIPKITIDEIITKLKEIMLIKKYLNDKTTMILLEHKAVIPEKDITYETPEMINKLFVAIKKTFNNNKEFGFGDDKEFGFTVEKVFGFVVDTAHLYCSDVDITTKENALKWINTLQYPEFIKLIHLNGNSSTNYKDIHAFPFSKNDLIWGTIQFKDSGAIAFIDFAKKNKIDIIIEDHFCNGCT